MSQTINTATLPAGNVDRRAPTRWGVIVAGGVLAATLGYGAALFTTGHLPWIDHSTATTTLEAAPAAQVPAVPVPQVGATPVQPGTLDPFEARTAPSQTQPTVGVTTAPAPTLNIELGTVDPFEARFASPQLQASIGAAGFSTPRVAVTQGALDPFETRFASLPTRTTASAEADGAVASDSAFEADYPAPRFR